MKKLVRSTVEDILYRFGLELSLISPCRPEYEATFRAVRPFTMTSRRRVYALIDAVNHVVKNNIPGAFVECGVWKGGSSLAAAIAFQARGQSERELYLYDTFEGMTEPTEADGTAALKGYRVSLDANQSSNWCRSPIDEIRSVVTRLAMCWSLVRGRPSGGTD